jgi:hypothetical protein
MFLKTVIVCVLLIANLSCLIATPYGYNGDWDNGWDWDNGNDNDYDNAALVDRKSLTIDHRRCHVRRVTFLGC